MNQEQIKKLHSVGFNIIPARGKYPDEKYLPLNEDGKHGWKIFQTEKYNGDFPDSNYAVICGQTSDRLVVLDLDTADLYPHFENYNTFTVKTSRGYHLYFRYTGEKPVTMKVDHPQFNQHIDIKSQGGYVISPFSKHESGAIYEIVKDIPIMEIKFEEIVKKIIDLGFVPANKKIREIVDEGLSEGNRDSGLFKLAMGARHMWGFDYEMLLICLNNFNETKCEPPLAKSQVRKIAQSAMTYDVEQPRYQEILEEYEGVKKLVFGEKGFWDDVTEYKRQHHPTGKFIFCLQCKKEIDANQFDSTHYGHKVKLK